MSEPARACIRCGVVKGLAEYYADPTKADGRHSICKECAKADRRERYKANPELYRARNAEAYRKHGHKWIDQGKKVRARALQEYGGKCACCGESHQEFLGIDHVRNDGEAHRRELKGYGRAIYQWLLKAGYPKDGRFQLLCHNCNISKGLYGGCPHKGPVPGRRGKTKPWRAA